MRIGLDATRVSLPTGEGIYTREVVKAMIRAFPEDEFVVVVPGWIEAFEGSNVTQVVYGEVDGLAARLRYAYRVGRMARSYRLDLFHNLTNYFLFNPGCPVVTTVHDLVTLRYPSVRSSRLHGWIYRHLLPRMLGRSGALAAISRATAADIQHFYGLGAMTRVVANGIDHGRFFCEPRLAAAVTERFALPEGYLLFVGYISPKKNLEVVLRALAALRDRDVRPTLVLVGKRGYGSQEVFELVRQLDLEAQVVETGYVSDEELTALYQGAGLFLFPSVFEGFGLPVVEAMACGTPVLSSNAGPMPELMGDNGCLCDPYQVDCWVAGIEAALADPSIQAEARLGGPARAKAFSWANTVQGLHGIYEDLVNTHSKASS
jgi:glycosyltransferase involved in cell wall biosynthesis